MLQTFQKSEKPFELHTYKVERYLLDLSMFQSTFQVRAEMEQPRDGASLFTPMSFKAFKYSLLIS